MKVLLPIDSKGDANLIVDFVGNHLWPAECVFRLLHVIGSVDSDEVYDREEGEASLLLDGISTSLRGLVPAAEITTYITSGDPALEIISTASTWNPEMIVMGYRVRSDIKSFMAGSVSRSVAVQAPCSVVVIRPMRDSSSGEGAIPAEMQRVAK